MAALPPDGVAVLNADDARVSRFGDVHLGFAVSVPDGLLVPVIRSADQMGLKELQQHTADLAKKARATPPRLKEAEMKGSFGQVATSAPKNPPARKRKMKLCASKCSPCGPR